MKIARKLIAAYAGLTAAASALAHEGHALEGAHWHATDAGVFMIVLALVGAALWFGGRK